MIRRVNRAKSLGVACPIRSLYTSERAPSSPDPGAHADTTDTPAMSPSNLANLLMVNSLHDLRLIQTTHRKTDTLREKGHLSLEKWPLFADSLAG
jgi:hypothetical protein